MADKRWMALPCVLFFVFAIESKADLLSAHVGTTDPLTENFTTLNTGPGTVGPVANDQGYPAWEITSNALYSQVEYIDSRALTSSQVATIASSGFTETLVARVDLNIAPAWNPSSPTIVGSTSTGVAIALGGPRFDIDLAINSQGNTVVILPTAYSFGPNNVVQATGLTDTLTDSAYHTYQLYYNPGTKSASLYIDGNLALSGYTGETQYLGFQRLYWGPNSGGQEFVNQVSLETGNDIVSTVPEPSSLLVTAVTASLALLGAGLLKRRQRSGPQE